MEILGTILAMGIPIAIPLHFLELPWPFLLVAGVVGVVLFLVGRWGAWKRTETRRSPGGNQVDYVVSRHPFLPAVGRVGVVNWRVWANGLGLGLGRGRGTLNLGPYRVKMCGANRDDGRAPGDVVYEVFKDDRLVGRKTVGGGMLGEDFEYRSKEGDVRAVRRGAAFYDSDGCEVGFVERDLRFLGSRRVLWTCDGEEKVFFLADVVLDNWSDWDPLRIKEL